MKITCGELAHEIHSITTQLVQLGLCDRQNFPSIIENNSGISQITLNNPGSFSTALGNASYRELYEVTNEDGSYNFKMLDGALVRMLYTFDHHELLSHRLAFFPSPDLEKFQTDPDIYLGDEIYADIISKDVVPFPIRFDFDRLEKLHVEVHHPKSHLTLGQYEKCRIPVSAPLTPFVFIEFILRNFYNTAFIKYTDKIHFQGLRFADTLTKKEQKIPHLKF